MTNLQDHMASIIEKRLALPTVPFIFLGGTVGRNNWRSDFVRNMSYSGIASEQLYNPVIEGWNHEVHSPLEDQAKQQSAFNLFYLASPETDVSPISALSIAEAMASLENRPESTVVVFDDMMPIGSHQRDQMLQIKAIMVPQHPRGVFRDNLMQAAQWLVPRLHRLQP